jgi:hypothetical protein
MTKVILGAVPLLLCLATAPALADQVLYCADTDVAGFVWDKSGAASVRRFAARRYIVKLEPATEYGLKQSRFISDTTESAASDPRKYECFNNLLGSLKGKDPMVPDASLSPMACHDGTSTESWIFFPGNTYTHAMIYGGPPSSGRDPNIFIAYGVCTPF